MSPTAMSPTSRGPIVGGPRAGERHIEELLRRRFGVDDAVVALLARLTVRAAAAGHTCLDLAQLDAELVASLDARRLARDTAGSRGGEPDGAEALPDLAVALAALRVSPAVRVIADEDASGDGVRVIEARPLVLDGTRLSTQREHAAEQRLVAALARRATADREPVPVAATRLTDDPDQVAAVAALADAGVRAGIGVLVGGPGTGKTTTVAALLAARLDADLAGRSLEGASTRPLRIALAAPTGKAAARLTESLRAALPRIAELHGDAVARQLGLLEATTVHRLLGIGRGGARRDGALLPHDVVVVDEASMLALPLAAMLVGALEDRTQLVLVGDPDQLESVETGSVLRALVDTLLADGGPLTRLTRNHRMESADGAADELARAVRDGDTERSLELLRTAAGAAAGGSLRFVATDDPLRHVREVVEPLLDDGAGGGLVAAAAAAEQGDGAGALAALGAARLLCAHRHGPHGASTWVERVRAQVTVRVGSRALSPGEVWISGEPVMALANDERSGLVNGDTGVVVGRGSARRIVFERRDGSLLERPAEALPDIVSAYAVTVHKSQGSEYGTVVVVLPPATSPLATRELLYTAITRARRRVVIVGSEGAVRAAVGRPSVRMGGLADGLERALPASLRSG